MAMMQTFLEEVQKTCQDVRSFVGQSVRDLFQSASSKSSEDLSRTIGAAVKALRGESEASITTPPSPLKTISRKMVDSILRSYSFDRTLGRVTFVIPAGLEFRETLNALNEACREIDPARKRDAVFGPDMKWYDRLPNRDTSQEQLITILPLVKGTEAMDRKQQEQILLKQGLTFADPRDLAIAAALHAYHHQGHNLLAGRWVRCSEPGFGIDFDRRAGLFVFKYDPGYPYHHNAAAGSPVQQ